MRRGVLQSLKKKKAHWKGKGFCRGRGRRGENQGLGLGGSKKNILKVSSRPAPGHSNYSQSNEGRGKTNPQPKRELFGGTWKKRPPGLPKRIGREPG